jgi:hypothetical protein
MNLTETAQGREQIDPRRDIFDKQGRRKGLILFSL